MHAATYEATPQWPPNPISACGRCDSKTQAGCALETSELALVLVQTTGRRTLQEGLGEGQTYLEHHLGFSARLEQPNPPPPPLCCGATRCSFIR